MTGWPARYTVSSSSAASDGYKRQFGCFAEIARERFNGTLAGTLTITAGAGGMGGAQPMAVTMNDGVVLVIAWGVCARIGIGAALLRNAVGKLPGAPNEFWYSIHFCMGILTGAFTIIGFFIAIVATQKEDKKHFKGAHHKAGLAILILVIM